MKRLTSIISLALLTSVADAETLRRYQPPQKTESHVLEVPRQARRIRHRTEYPKEKEVILDGNTAGYTGQKMCTYTYEMRGRIYSTRYPC